MTDIDANEARWRSAVVAFLHARLDEDEAVAKLAARGGDLRDAADWASWRWDEYRACVWSVDPVDPSLIASWPDGGAMDSWDGEHIARHDPRRVLAEVAAKRTWLAYEQRTRTPRDVESSDVLRAMAAIYADHPDHDVLCGAERKKADQ